MDYDLQSQLLVQALKEAEGQRAVRMPKATVQNGNLVWNGPGATLDAGFNRALGNYQKPQIEQQMADQSAMQQGEVDRLQGELANAPQGMDYTDPEQLTAENRRQMDIASQMQRLPMARKMAETMWAKGIGTPDRIAELQMRQIETGNQRAKTLEEQARRDEANKTHALQMQANQLEAAKDRAAMLAAAKASGGGGGPRDRFSVQTGPDNQMYRVNLETGQADPVTIRSALPNAVSAQQPGVGLQKPKAPPTEAERTAAGYLGRMEATEKALGGLKGGEATELTAAAGALPLVGPYVQRKAETLPQSQYRQYADDWIRAKLRKESGAVIGKEEMEKEYITYFPQPGDRPEVAAQKEQARLQAQEQLRSSAGQVKPTQARPRGATYADPAKEARYQEFLRSQGK